LTRPTLSSDNRCRRGGRDQFIRGRTWNVLPQTRSRGTALRRRPLTMSKDRARTHRMSVMVKPAQCPPNAGVVKRWDRQEKPAWPARAVPGHQMPVQLHDLHVNGALVANGGDPTSHAIGLDLALHPHETGLILLPSPFSHLHNLALFQLPGGVLQLPRCIL